MIKIFRYSHIESYIEVSTTVLFIYIGEFFNYLQNFNLPRRFSIFCFLHNFSLKYRILTIPFQVRLILIRWMRIFSQNDHVSAAHPSSQWVRITTQKGVARSPRPPTPTSPRVVQQTQLPKNVTWMQSFFNAWETCLRTSTVTRFFCILVL